jgi:predicted HTH transcriptional regulator
MRSESETLELKRSTSELKEGVISVSAILNKNRKGVLYFGVRNDGIVLGQAVSEQTLRDVSRMISERIEPRIYPKVERVKLSGKGCIRVRFSGEDAPYLAFGRAYIRVGEEDRQLSARELERMFLRRNRDHAPWESELSERGLSEVHAPTLRRVIKEANAAGRIDFKFGTVKGTLTKLGIMAGGRLLKAAEVLFCKNNSLEVQAAVFAGADKTTFIDIKQFKGNLYGLLDQSETYVKEHIDWRVRFGKLEREEIPEVPVDALRCAANGVRVEFKILKSGFLVTFRRKPAEKLVRGAAEKPVVKTVVKPVVKTVVKTGEKIIALIRRNPVITRAEIAKNTGLSVRGVEWNLNELKKEGMLKRVGPDKGGHWEVVK